MAASSRTRHPVAGNSGGYAPTVNHLLDAHAVLGSTSIPGRGRCCGEEAENETKASVERFGARTTALAAVRARRRHRAGRRRGRGIAGQLMDDEGRVEQQPGIELAGLD